jgi:hypothetical protein
MAIAFDVAQPAFGAAAITTLESAAFTIGSGSDRILMVGVLSGAGSPVDPSAVKWGGSGGASLTQVGSTVNVGSFVKVSLWRLVNPASGSNTVHVTWGSAQDERALVAAAYTGVDQTTPLGTPATATGTNTTPTVNVSSAAGELVVDSVGFLDQGGNNRTLAVGASQTSRAEVEGANLGFEGLGISDEAGTATVTMSWTTSGNVDNWGIIGVALKPSVGGGGATIYNRKIFDSAIFKSRLVA